MKKNHKSKNNNNYMRIHNPKIPIKKLIKRENLISLKQLMKINNNKEFWIVFCKKVTKYKMFNNQRNKNRLNSI